MLLMWPDPDHTIHFPKAGHALDVLPRSPASSLWCLLIL